MRTWEVDHDMFLAQVESVVLIALLAMADEPDADTPETWCPAAAAVLRRQQAVQLFAALPPSLPDPIKLRVDQLRLLSAGLTPRSGHQWLRLSDTACEFLEPAALLDEEGGRQCRVVERFRCVRGGWPARSAPAPQRGRFCHAGLRHSF
ncbi:hypothetical protein [Streptomyces sp. NPDC001978]|uniref:hypothetical protein n=1 Tax=Streptomyces sp. NPDC001978 TaxID=3364627 RepID=UPI0036C7A69A